ncbi:hypothetical protein TSOC_000251 [Tetrabaena socialis]|uniref:Uncharacterized protein n=1 Tax=Tetrabaena socialis TaxID=47790 RepID=A0A2J8AJU4_9CHLO|nr:hypothetical protein TSOC_000251 [Tetrabaena socialis]|eukprot:PNH12796.1 hypothetical protein TSOC_000251 [Tetrabaena socialis]
MPARSHEKGITVRPFPEATGLAPPSCLPTVPSHREWTERLGSAAQAGSGAEAPLGATSGMAAAGAAAPLVEESDWERVGSYLTAYDEQREDVIKRCRDVQKLAKQAVYSLHRGDAARAMDQLAKGGDTAAQGSFSAAMEEVSTQAPYAEAMAFACFLREGRLIRSDELPLAQPEERTVVSKEAEASSSGMLGLAVPGPVGLQRMV